jgi:CMP-N-acetylneuraminic acid synthetase
LTTIATICARGGSKGLPGKNVRPLLGKPLIVYTIEQALAVPEFAGVYVSTDSPEIAEVARAAGATVPFLRPAELAHDAAPKIPVIRHLVEHVEAGGARVDTVCDLDPTSPLRDVADVRACLALLAEAEVVITAYRAEKNPYFNMVERQPDGNWRLVKAPDGSVVSRQQAPAVFAMNASIYVWRRAALERSLWECRLQLHEMPRERSIDVDSLIDFMLVELLMKERESAAR